MISVLFVCLGNICRSPMAEGVFKRILEREGCTADFHIDSAGLHDYHRGELPDERMRRHAESRGYCLIHRSRPVTKEDFEIFDYIIGMDSYNMKALSRMATGDAQRAKLHSMTDFCSRHKAKEVPDPYYGGAAGFEYVIDLLEDACEGLFKTILPHQ